MKISKKGAELLHVDRRTNRNEANSRDSKFREHA
jgi:hypothetical protein